MPGWCDPAQYEADRTSQSINAQRQALSLLKLYAFIMIVVMGCISNWELWSNIQKDFTNLENPERWYAKQTFHEKFLKFKHKL